MTMLKANTRKSAIRKKCSFALVRKTAVINMFNVNLKKSSLHNNYCVALKCATILRGPSPRHCVSEQHSFFQRNVAVVATLRLILTGQRFESQTYRSKDKHIAVRLIGR